MSMFTNLPRAQAALTTPTKREPKRIIVECDGIAYTAHIDGAPADFTHGETAADAILSLISRHEAELGIRIVWPGEKI
jgi:hypothetical protein